MKQLTLKTTEKQTYTKNFQAYVLRVSSQFSTEKSLSLFGGLCEKEKNFTTIKEEANKALQAGYDRILLPWNFVFHPEKQKLIKWINSQPNNFILAVHSLSFKFFYKLFNKKNLFLELNLDSWDSQFLEEIENSPWPFYITIPAHKKLNLESLNLQLNNRYNQKLEERTNQSDLSLELFLKNCKQAKNELQNKNLNKLNNNKKNNHLKQLISQYKKLFFNKSKLKTERESSISFKSKIWISVHFPCSHQAHPDLYNSKEIYNFLSKSYYPPPPYDIYNLSIPKDLKLEPSAKAEIVYNIKKSACLPSSSFNSQFFQTKHSHIEKKQAQEKKSIFSKFKLKPLRAHKNKNLQMPDSLKASVIITAYNCEKELLLTVEHLYQQELPKKEWELIIIDDGSEKKLSESLKNLKFLKEMNFKLFFLPRVFPRTGPKDHRFRAGIARNLGAKYAKSLIFRR